MLTKDRIKTLLLAALVTLALGGFLLHLRIHPLVEHSYNLMPFVAGLLSIVMVPSLLSFRQTLAFGYVLNGMLVILGTIVMAHFALIHWPQPVTLEAVFLKTTLADILILWAKFLVGKAVFDLETYGYGAEVVQKGVAWRFPNLGWWLVHVALISLVYGLGNILWR